MTHPSAFWDRWADRYSKRPIADPDSYERKLSVTRSYFRPDMEVLELGCGTGSTALLHAPHVKRITATDISAKMIEIARAKAAAEGVSNVAFEQASVDSLARSPTRYDVVLALSVLHLMEDRAPVIDNVHRLLKPGGVFVTSTPCLAETMKIFKYIGPLGRWLGLLPTLRIFTEAELIASMTDAGFAIDHHWRQGEGKAVFLVAKKAVEATVERQIAAGASG